MIYVDQKYISSVSHKLRNFTKKHDDYNFSCPICGDSKKKKRLARAWFYRNANTYSFKCYNCNAPFSFYMVLKLLDEHNARQYLIEKKFSSFSLDGQRSLEKSEPVIEVKPQIVLNNILDDITCILEFNENHPALKYVKKRMIPKEKWDKIYFAPKFIRWINSIKPGTYTDASLKYDHPRLIFPFFDENNIPFAISGRAFGKEEPKYLTIKFDDSREKIYGVETIDTSKDIYVVEGQIDSMFLPNCVAAAGSAMKLDFVQRHKDKCIIIYDNEPRSKEIMKMMETTIESGFKVFVWPDTVRFKDINESVMNGYEPSGILNMINQNTHIGLTALLKYKAWRKIK